MEVKSFDELIHLTNGLNESIQGIFYQLNTYSNYVVAAKNRGIDLNLTTLNEDGGQLTFESKNGNRTSYQVVQADFLTPTENVTWERLLSSISNILNHACIEPGKTEKFVIIKNKGFWNIFKEGGSIKLCNNDTDFINLEEAPENDGFLDESAKCYKLKNDLANKITLLNLLEDYLNLAREIAEISVFGRRDKKYPYLLKHKSSVKKSIISKDKSFQTSFVNGTDANLKVFREEFERIFQDILISGDNILEKTVEMRIKKNFWSNLPLVRNLDLPPEYLEEGEPESALSNPFLARMTDESLEQILEKLTIIIDYDPGVSENLKRTNSYSIMKRKLEAPKKLLSFQELKKEIKKVQKILPKSNDSSNLKDLFLRDSCKIYIEFFKNLCDQFLKESFGSNSLRFKKGCASNIFNEKILCIPADGSFEENLVNMSKFCQILENKKKSFILVHSRTTHEFMEIIGDVFSDFDSEIFLIYDCNNKFDLKQKFLNKLIGVASKNSLKNLVLVNTKNKMDGLNKAVYENYTDRSTMSDLTKESANKLLEREIDYQGQKISLNNLVEPKDIESTNIADIMSISSFGTRKNIQLPDSEEDDLKETIIHRNLVSNQIILDRISSRFLDEICFDIDDYRRLKSSFPGANIHLLRVDEKIITTDRGCSKSRSMQILEGLVRAIKQKSSEGLEIFWEKTFNDISGLLHYISGVSGEKMSEEDLVTNSNQKVILISDPSYERSQGIMENLLALTKKQDPLDWISELNFDSLITSGISLNEREVKKNIESSISPAKGSLQRVLIDKLIKNGKRCHLFVQGIPRVDLKSLKIILENKSRFNKIYISVSANLGIKFQKFFNVLCYEVQPIIRSAQINYLWENVDAKYQTLNGRKTVENLLDEAFRSVSAGNLQRISIGLVLKMIKELNLIRNEDFKPNFVFIFQEYLDRGIEVLRRAEPTLNVEEFLWNLALKETQLENYGFSLEEKFVSVPSGKFKIIQERFDKNFFAHKHFADFVVSKHILGQSVEVLKDFLKDILLEPKYQVVRIFINQQLKLKSFTEPAYKQLGANLINFSADKDVNHSFIDHEVNIKISENPLTIASKEENLKILRFLCKSLNAVDTCLETEKKQMILLEDENKNNLLMLNYLSYCHDDIKFIEWFYKSTDLYYIWIGIATDEIRIMKHLVAAFSNSDGRNSLLFIDWMLESKKFGPKFMEVLLEQKNQKYLPEIFIKNWRDFDNVELFFKILKNHGNIQKNKSLFLGRKIAGLDFLSFIFHKFSDKLPMLELSERFLKVLLDLFEEDEKIKMEVLENGGQDMNFIETCISYCPVKENCGLVVTNVLKFFKDPREFLLNKMFSKYLIQRDKFFSFLTQLELSEKNATEIIELLDLNRTTDSLPILNRDLIPSEYVGPSDVSIKSARLDILKYISQKLKFSEREVEMISIDPNPADMLQMVNTKKLLKRGFGGQDLLHFLLNECVDKTQIEKSVGEILGYMKEQLNFTDYEIMGVLLTQDSNKMDVLQSMINNIAQLPDPEDSLKILAFIKVKLKFTPKVLIQLLTSKGHLDMNLLQLFVNLNFKEADIELVFRKVRKILMDDLILDATAIREVFLAKGMNDMNLLQFLFWNSKSDSAGESFRNIIESLKKHYMFSDNDMKLSVMSLGYCCMNLVQYALKKSSNKVDIKDELKEILISLKYYCKFDEKDFKDLLSAQNTHELNLLQLFVHQNSLKIEDSLIDVIMFLKNEIKLDNTTIASLILAEGPRRKMNLIPLLFSKYSDPEEICEKSANLCKKLREILSLDELPAEVLNHKVFGQFSIFQLIVQKFMKENKPLADTLENIQKHLELYFGIKWETFCSLFYGTGSDGLLIIQNLILDTVESYNVKNLRESKAKAIFKGLKTKLNIDFSKIKENFILNEKLNLLKISIHEETDPSKILKETLEYLKANFQINSSDILEIFQARSYFGKNLLQFMVSSQSDKNSVHICLTDTLEYLITNFNLKWEDVKKLITSPGYKDMNLLHFIVFDCRFYTKVEEIFIKLLKFLVPKIGGVSCNLSTRLVLSTPPGQVFSNHSQNRKLVNVIFLPGLSHKL